MQLFITWLFTMGFYATAVFFAVRGDYARATFFMAWSVSINLDLAELRRAARR